VVDPLLGVRIERRGTGGGGGCDAAIPVTGAAELAAAMVAGVRLLAVPVFETGPLCAIPGPSDIALDKKRQKDFYHTPAVYNHPRIMTSRVFNFTHIHVCQTGTIACPRIGRSVPLTCLTNGAIYALA
jgi:hypothetical protein